MAMKRCPVCGERYSDTYKNCPFCEEDEYWEDEEDTRRPLLRDGGRGSSRSRSPYSIVTPVLIVLIVLMAALLIYLLYGDKIAGKFSKDSPDKPGVQEPKDPDPTPTPTPGDSGEDPNGTEPSGDTTPGDGQMPEDNGASGNAGSSGNASGEGSGGMSYASAAALPGGLTLSRTDFSRKVSEGDWQLKVSGGTGTYTWISENPSIATVSSNGTVTPVASGTTNVVVTDGTKKAICIVRVTGGSAPASTGSSGTTTSSGGTTSSGTTSSGGSLRAGSAKVINGGNGVRVRSGPSTNHEILATIPNGGSVQIVESAGNDWYKITFTATGGVTTTGYMKGEFLSNS